MCCMPDSATVAQEQVNCGHGNRELPSLKATSHSSTGDISLTSQSHNTPVEEGEELMVLGMQTDLALDPDEIMACTSTSGDRGEFGDGSGGSVVMLGDSAVKREEASVMEDNVSQSCTLVRPLQASSVPQQCDSTLLATSSQSSGCIYVGPSPEPSLTDCNSLNNCTPPSHPVSSSDCVTHTKHVNGKDQSSLSQRSMSSTAVGREEIDGGRIGGVLVQSGVGSEPCRKWDEMNKSGAVCENKGEDVEALEKSLMEFDDLLGEFESPDDFLSHVKLDTLLLHNIHVLYMHRLRENTGLRI